MTFANRIHNNMQYEQIIIILPLSPMDPTLAVMLTMMPVCCFALSAGCWPKPPPPFWRRGAKYLAMIRGPTVLVVKVEIIPWKGRLLFISSYCTYAPSWTIKRQLQVIEQKTDETVTCAETSLRLVSPFPEGWSIAEELTTRSSRPKVSFTRSAASLISSSRFTSSLTIVILPGCCSASARRSTALSRFRHVAITADGLLLFKIYLQNSSPSPLLAPWMSAMGFAMIVWCV